HWTTMLWLQILIVVFEGNENVILIEGLDRQIGGVASPRVLQHIVRLGSWLGTLEDLADVNALPDVAVAAPCGNAMDVAGDGGTRQRQQLLPGQLERLLDLTPNFKAVGLGIELGSGFIAEHRPLLSQVLGWREAVESIRALLGGPTFTPGAKEAREIHG